MNRTAERGKFIVLEGIDGAGTTTQIARLAKNLLKLGHEARAGREPSDGPIGTMLRLIMSGRIVISGGLAPGWETMALLFAADRMDHVESDIEPGLAAGACMLSDRYDASSLAYQSVTSGAGGAETVAWIASLNRYAYRPDLTIVLDVPADVAGRRRELRGEASQLYEQNETQHALAVFYKNLPQHLPNDRIRVISGEGDADQVESAILQEVLTAFPALAESRD